MNAYVIPLERSGWAGSIAAVQLYDDLKVRAIVEEIDCRDHTGGHRVGTPALFGMNFQSVNVAQKSPAGAYRDTRAMPGGALLDAIEHVDDSIGRILAELHRRGLASTTLLIIHEAGEPPRRNTEFTAA